MSQFKVITLSQAEHAVRGVIQDAHTFKVGNGGQRVAFAVGSETHSKGKVAYVSQKQKAHLQAMFRAKKVQATEAFPVNTGRKIRMVTIDF